MFVTKARFDRTVELLESQIKWHRDEYWELKRAHFRLLAHLGLHEQELPAKTVLRSKGGPEQSEG